MKRSSKGLERLGEIAAEVSDRTADPTTLDRARRRWMSVRAVPSRRPYGRFALAVAALLAASAGLVHQGIARSTLSFEVGSPPVRGEVGEWVAASSDAPLELRFSEGSQLSLVPGARMRVTSTRARGADVLIERGMVHASIVHESKGTQWALFAGPFEVRVTGTVFDAGWDPASETFELAMQEGSVLVSGPLLLPERAVVAGERLTVSVHEGKMVLKSGHADEGGRPEPPASASAIAEPMPKCVGSAAALPAITASPKVITSVAAPDWHKLAEKGRYRDALDALERAGFEKEIERASSSDLLALADAARFAGRPERARTALFALRRRFGEKGRSAFLLGKIAADQQTSYGEAVTWFETYLREEPGGALAEQALGRLLEIKKRTDPNSAKTVAARYLERYPKGAYALLAKSLLSP